MAQALIFSPRTKPFLDAYLHDPASGLLLTGPAGVGLFTIARFLAESLTSHEHTIVVQPEKHVITIERIRQLYEETRAARTERLFVIVDDSELMTIPAANAFLKLLEEPTAQTYFILTSHVPGNLLATIRSRVQEVVVHPAESSSLLSEIADGTKRAQVAFMAPDRPAEIRRLTADDAYFTGQAATMKKARQVLEGTRTERFLAVGSVTGRDGALLFVEALAKLLRLSLEKEPSFRFALAAEETNRVADRLARNGNVKAQLLYLMTKLP